jgi:hypothetical protein
VFRGIAARAAAFSIGLSCGTVFAGPDSMLDPSKPPQDTGWSVVSHTGEPISVKTNGTYLTLDSVVSQDPLAVQWFYREVPFDFSSGFSIDFALQVHNVAQPHNLFDAGVMFYGSTEDPRQNFAGGPRGQMIYFDPGRIGWGDDTATFAMDTTDRFHQYRLTVSSDGVAQVFADGTLALERSDFVKIPRIGFGDMTNDPGVNGSFSIAYINVTAPAVPGPPTAWMFGLGLGGLGVRFGWVRRARKAGSERG